MACALAGPAVAAADEPLANLDRRGAEVERAAEAVRTGPADALLTGPSSATPEDIALGYVRAHAAAFGLGDVDALRLVAKAVSPDGITHLRYDQVVDGVASYDAGLGAHVTRDGRLIEITGNAVPDAQLPTAKAALGATASLGAARTAVHGSGLAPGLTSATRDSAEFTTGETARLLWTDTASDGPRLAWSVVTDGADGNAYNVLVDAGSGDVLTRTSLSDDLGQVKYYRKDPAASGQVPLTMAPAWYDDNAGGTRLWGDYARTYGDYDDADPAPGDEASVATQIPASGTSGGGPDWLYTTTNAFPGATPCPSSGCTWNSADPRTKSDNLNEAATNAHVLVSQYHDYLERAPIGFDEASGNFQRDNTPGIGQGGDYVRTEVDDSATKTTPGPAFNNANFATPPDGTPPRMQMYLWTTYDVNGADVADVVWHEYGHGLSSRLVVAASGVTTLLNGQAAMMGEAWSDFYALDHLVESGLTTDTATPGEVTMGAYVTGGGGIRAKPIDCPVDPAGATAACNGSSGPQVLGGYTYGDIAQTNNTSPHNGSEVFAETLWDLRAAVGRIAALTLVTGGLRLSPGNPSMLDERDAILREAVAIRSAPGAADDYYDDVWRVFAARGFGYSASTASTGDLRPVEAYNLPAGLTAAGSATITDPYPAGDADGIAEPGETVRVAQPLSAAALGDVSGITGTLAAASGGGAIVDASASWPTLGLARVGSNATPLSVRLPSTCGTGVRTALTATAPGASGGTVTTPVWIETGAGSATRVPITDFHFATSGITASAAGTVTDVDVRIDELRHTWLGDLTVQLVHDGVTVTLLSQANPDWAADDLEGITFDDEAAGSIAQATGSPSPASGSYRPAGSLAAFDGHPLAGSWRLSVYDSASPDTGSIEAWGLVGPGLGCSPVEIPVPATGAADGVSPTSATLHGSVDPAGRATGLRFEYGTTTGYGSATATQDVGAGSGAVPGSATLTGLAPGTTYHARVDAIREGGVVAETGQDVSFTTAPAPSGDDGSGGGSGGSGGSLGGGRLVGPGLQPTPGQAPVFAARPRVAVARRASHGRRAATLAFALSGPGSVRATLARGVAGTRAGSACGARRRRGRACTRYVRYGRAIGSAVKDTRSVTIRLGSLPRGRYTVSVAVVSGGRPVTVSFTVR